MRDEQAKRLLTSSATPCVSTILTAREISGGRATRQPRQLRKEAAPTGQARVAVPASTFFPLCAQNTDKVFSPALHPPLPAGIPPQGGRLAVPAPLENLPT